MNQFKYLLIVTSLLLSACAQTPVQPEAVNPVNPHESQDETAMVLPNVELTDELLFGFLLSEIASQRGQTGLAAKGSLELAQKSRDPRIARRAAQLAVESGQLDAAIAAIKVWQELEPDSTVAMRMSATVLLRSGKIDEARQEINKVLKAEEAQVGIVFMQLFKMLASYPDTAAALQLMRELAQPYPQVAEAHWAVAQMAQASGDDKLALAETRLARSLRPEWDMAASLEAILLQRTAPQQGLEVLNSYLSSYPKAGEIRMQYARALLEQKQFSKSRDEFQRLANEDPENPELPFAVALISMQMNDFQGAEKQLKQALSRGKKDQDAVQYYLGQLSEAKNSDEEAIANYQKVKGGEYLFSAQVRVAYLLGKRGQLAEARKQLHQVKAENTHQRVQLVLIESQLLREANQLTESYQLLQKSLAKLPDHPDLLYATAMMADKVDKPDVFEQLMRKLIQIKPDYAHAYNALGYSMLERNERIPEGVTLVEKALQLAPDDAAIMDSVGWGYYRVGRLDDSVKMLRRAMTANPDPEIAAHLGEVLWVRGEKGAAQKVWQDSLNANPGNVVLQAVMKKFMP